MGIIIRQSIKSTAVTYAGVILGALNTLVLFPNFLEPDQFGLTRVLLSIAALMAQLSEFGGANVLIKYVSVFKDERETFKKFVFWVLLKALGAYAVAALVVYCLKGPLLHNYQEQSSIFEHFFGYIFPLAIFILLFNLMEAYARTLFRITFPTLLREVYLRVFLLVIILLYHFDILSFDQFILLFAFSYCSAMLIIAGYIFWLDRIVLTPTLGFAKHEKVGEIFVYGIFSILTSGIWRAVAQLDVIMLGALAPPLANAAIYSIGFYIVTLIQYPQRALHLISEPIVAKFIQNEQWDSVRDLFQRVSLNQFVIGLFLFLGIWVNMDNLYHFLPEKYHGISATVLILMLGRLFDMATGFNGEVIHYSKYYRFNFIAGIVLAGSCVITNLIFIPKYSILGAAIATAISLTLFNIIRIAFIYLKFGFVPFTFGMVKAIIIGLITWGVTMIIPDVGNVYLDMALRSVVVVALFLLPVYFLKISEDLNQIVLKILGRMKVFKF